MGRWAADNGVRPELALCSTAARAQATLELASDGLGRPETLVEAGLYHASALAVMKRLHTVPPEVARCSSSATIRPFTISCPPSPRPVLPHSRPAPSPGCDSRSTSGRISSGLWNAR